MIKNKRLKPEVEKSELELFRKGQFVIEDEEKEDATAVTANPPEEKKASIIIFMIIIFLNMVLKKYRQKHLMWELVQKVPKLHHQYNILDRLQMYILGYPQW